MNVFLNKNKEIKINNKLGVEYNNKNNGYTKNIQQVNLKDKEFEIKKIKRKKLSSTNNNFNLNKNNNHIVLRHNTFNKLKDKDLLKEKKGNNQIKKVQKTMILEQDLSKEIKPLNFHNLNNINTNKNKNNSNQKNIPKLNKGSTSRKESKKIAKNLSRENIRGGGNNFLQGGTQRKKILMNDIENNNKILRLYDLNILNKDDYTFTNNTNEITFTTNNNQKNKKEKKHSSNNLLINSGNKYKGDKKVSLVDKFTNNLEYYKNHNQIKIDINNINNSITNITNKNINILYKAQSNDKIIKNYMNISGNKSKENIVKNIKNIIIENNNKNNFDLISRLKDEINKGNATNKNNNKNNNKEAININQQIKKINTNDYNSNKIKQNLTISSGQTKLDVKTSNIKYELSNLNTKKIIKNKTKEKIMNKINKNINPNINNKNGKTINNNNNYISYINNTSSSNVDFQQIKSHLICNININKSNTNIKEKLKNSSKKSINSINSITKLNTLQNEDIKKRIKYNNYKTKINFSSPKMTSVYERHKDKPHLRRPLSNNNQYKNNDKTYSPKLNYIPKYLQTESNVTNNNIFNNRLEYFGNYSISSRKENIFSKINNNFKNNNNYINILNKRKLSAKIKDDRGNSLLKLIENKDKNKEKEIINLTKRRPRKFENEVNNLFTEISNIYNNKNSFFNFGFKKNNNNSIKNSHILENFQKNNKENNGKYSFISILKPKAISQQKRYNNINEEKNNNHENLKNKRDTKSLTFISKDNNEKKKNISLLRKKKIIKLIHMMDEFNNSKSKSKSKRKNKSYNNSKNRGASAIKERKNTDKFKLNYLGEDDKILDNVIKNEIISYTINIISKYNDKYKKIGLSKIKLYDKNNNEIFIVNSNSNIKNNEEENVNYLFNTKKYYYNNKTYIADFKDNLYIKFYVNFKKSNIIKYLKIINYENNNDKISPVKEIKISHGKKVIFQGTLNVNYFNIINISENKNNYEIKEFPLFTATKKRGSSANITNSSISNIYNSNYKRNNTRSYSTFRASSGKKNNKIPKKQLIKINSVRNISNINNEYKNIDNYKLINYNNTEIEENNYNNKIIENSICNTIAYNNTNDFEKNIFMRERFISDNNISRENNKKIVNENNIHEGININKFNLNKYKLIDRNYSFEEETNNNNSSFIKFKRIRLVLSSNYGHPNLIGLTGLEFYDNYNKLIDIETAETIGAMPKDLHTIYNNENDYRIFENIFNGENNINDSYNMWVTLFDTPNKEFPYIELSFNNYIYLSKINIFNFNKNNELDKCAKTIELFLDNKYYNTIHLRQGIGESINENIIQKENSNINNTQQNSNKKNNKSFCQEIFFPIKNDYYEKNQKNKKKILPLEEIKVEYASNKYEQSYETAYMPNGQIIKFQLINNYYKGKNIDNHCISSNTNSATNIHIKNYNYIGINILNIFDENGNDLLSQKEIEYKIISNREMIISEEHQIILNCSQNEDANNNIYFLFEYPVNISYIQIDPFSLIKNDKNFLNSAKEIKIFCDKSVIFEGELYNSQKTIILFTSNEKILKNINVNYLTKKRIEREIIEIKNEDCFSLTFKD